jgi:hypothetical protein
MSSLRVITCVLFLSSLSLSQVGFKKSGYDTTNFNGSVAVGDFNGDGYPDIVALDGPHGQLTIDRNNGDGTFARTAQYSISTLENSGWVQTADFDGDGKLDLVFWVAFSQQMELWHGNGDGTFKFWKDVPNLVGPPLTVQLTDVNKDGAVDLVALECEDGRDTTCFAKVYLNDKLGNFTPTDGPSIAKVMDMVVADFNGDGKPDIIISVYGPEMMLALYPGNGDGTFGPLISSPTTSAGALTVGSFNKGDAALDIAISSPPTVSVYLNNGKGSFGLRSKPAAGSQVFALAAGPINGDGYQDLLAVNTDFDTQIGNLQYLLGQGNGYFNSPVKINYSFTSPGAPVIRDLSLNGRHDIVVPAGATYILTNTNAAITCAPPAVAGLAAKFCTQVQPSIVSQTVRISGNSPVGVARMELWIDGKKSYGLWSDQLSLNITLAPGPHRIAAVAVDQFGHYAESVQLVTVP